MKIIKYLVVLCLLTVLSTHSLVLAVESESYRFKLESILAMAIDNDPWLKESQYLEKALLLEGEVSSTLPDPKLSLNMANLPVDNFSFRSQAMTQFKLGLSQSFARGDSLELKQEIKTIESQAQPFLRTNRKNQLIMQVGNMWFDAFKAQKSLELIYSKKHLFYELSDVAELRYASGLKKTGQQELVRAELELLKLDEQLTVYSDKLHSAILKLSEFVELPFSYLNEPSSDSKQYVSATLPEIKLLDDMHMVKNHPLISVADTQIKMSSKHVELKKQDYKPQFTLNGSYGIRQDAIDGSERPDFFSVGVSFDLPLFAEHKQDKDVEAAVYKKEGQRERKSLIMKKLTAAYQTEMSQLTKLKTRLELYENKILPQASLQAEASLNAYSNQEADFSELVRARVDEVNMQLNALDLSVEIEKSKLKANYYLSATSEQMLNQIYESEETDFGESDSRETYSEKTDFEESTSRELNSGELNYE